MKPAIPIFLALGLATAAEAVVPTVDQMRGQRRVLVVAAPRADDDRLARQRRMLTDWTQGAHDRDVSIVEVIGNKVIGAGDHGPTLRRSRRLPMARFTVLLIGKDGNDAVRSHDPLSSRSLTDRIDAMPMRRAGER
jgi:hypothetical protein